MVQIGMPEPPVEGSVDAELLDMARYDYIHDHIDLDVFEACLDEVLTDDELPERIYGTHFFQLEDLCLEWRYDDDWGWYKDAVLSGHTYEWADDGSRWFVKVD